jgi:hypothetical protein
MWADRGSDFNKCFAGMRKRLKKKERKESRKGMNEKRRQDGRKENNP